MQILSKQKKRSVSTRDADRGATQVSSVRCSDGDSTIVSLESSRRHYRDRLRPTIRDIWQAAGGSEHSRIAAQVGHDSDIEY